MQGGVQEWWWWWWWSRVVLSLLLALMTQGTHSIRITRVVVPPTLEAGGEAELDCKWQEENDQMYSIKWYQGAHEFYRYTPSVREPVQVFENPTLTVDRDRSWGGSVRISNVSLLAEGPFHCEVSADGPTFHTASDSAKMKVVDLPDGDPDIKGVRVRYQVGDWVDLRCISHRSRPPAFLTFNLNTQPVHEGWLEPVGNYTNSEGLTTTSIRLRFPLQPNLLVDGEAQVQCVSDIPGVYHSSATKVLTTRTPYHASMSGAAGGGPSPAPTTLLLMTLLTTLLQRL